MKNPYSYVPQLCGEEDEVLSLCCGIGTEFKKLRTPNVTAVDITPEYLEIVHKNYPTYKIVKQDALNFTENQLDNSYDVVVILDGLEHFIKSRGKQMIKEMKRVARKHVVVFTPDGFVKNEPLNAWDVKTKHGDEAQQHRSGWPQKELESLGFTLVEDYQYVSPHGEPYRAVMMRYDT